LEHFNALAFTYNAAETAPPKNKRQQRFLGGRQMAEMKLFAKM